MDIKHAYIEKGSGAPLILLHGNGESKEYFEYQIPFFSKDHRVIALDTRGHGETPKGTKPFKLWQFAEDLKDFMEEKGIEKANILGFSDGGNIAVLFALKYPEKVDRLILNGANIFPEGLAEPLFSQIKAAYERNKAALPEHPEKQDRFDLLALMVEEPKIDPKELEELTMPVLVIAGTEDMITEEHTRLIAEHIPGSELVFLQGTHFIAHENPEEFNEIVGEFLKIGELPAKSFPLKND